MWKLAGGVVRPCRCAGAVRLETSSFSIIMRADDDDDGACSSFEVADFSGGDGTGTYLYHLLRVTVYRHPPVTLHTHAWKAGYGALPEPVDSSTSLSAYYVLTIKGDGIQSSKMPCSGATGSPPASPWRATRQVGYLTWLASHRGRKRGRRVARQ